VILLFPTRKTPEDSSKTINLTVNVNLGLPEKTYNSISTKRFMIYYKREVHEITKKLQKTDALEKGRMYTEHDTTPAFEKFYLPFGDILNGNNRWVNV
jgi:hypothetical protein